MDSMLNVGAWFVAIPTTGILGLISLQIIICMSRKGSTMKLSTFRLILLSMIAGLSWGWIIR